MTPTQTTETLSYDAACEYLRSKAGCSDSQVEICFAQACRYCVEGRDLGLVAAEWDIPMSVIDGLLS